MQPQLLQIQQLGTPVAHARNHDPQTSHDAAASVKNISELQATILKMHVMFGAMRDDDLVRRVQMRTTASESSIRSRRAELVRVGMIEAARDESGAVLKTMMPTGSKGIVWKAV